MSIAPFLPGLVAAAPAPADAGTTTGAEGEVAFMDALAAALAVQPVVQPTPVAPVAPVAPATPSAPSASTVAPAELGFVTAELGFVTADLGFVTAESGLPTAETAVVAADPRSAPADAAPVAEPDAAEPGMPTATPVPGASTSDPNFPVEVPPAKHLAALPTPAVPADHPATGAPVRDDVPALQPLAATSEQSATLTDATATHPISTVTTPNSGVTNPNSAVTNPKSVERVVLTRVFPEVTRLASSGNGTHRITLTLQPAQLGEVRVTLVVRDGAVSVRMSGEAGDGAVRQALATGAPELQRMLERGGATEARVLVRELNAAPLLTPTPAARNDATPSWSGQPDQQPGQQSGQQDFGQAQGFAQSRDQSRGQGREGRPVHPDEQAGRRADVVPGSTPTPGRLDRNL